MKVNTQSTVSVRYAATRLKFIRQLIEPLADEGAFAVETSQGTFRMTKADFLRVFRNVVESQSYRVGGWYGYSKIPKKALIFRVGAPIDMPHRAASRFRFELPPFLDGTLTKDRYVRWLHRKAMAHVRRDRRRGNKRAAVSAYKRAIHDAVVSSNGCDAYTGEALHWHLISTYENSQSKRHGRKYKKLFALLPTVDHIGDGLGAPGFAICSWMINDAKTDLAYDELVVLCRRIVSRHELRNQGSSQ